jgi:hypothetical protein
MSGPPHHALARPAGSLSRPCAAAGAVLVTSTSGGPARSTHRDYGSGAKDDGAHLSHLWAGRPAGGLPPLWTLSDVPNVLAAPWRRARGDPATAGAAAALLHPLWAADHAAGARSVPPLLCLLAPARGGAPAGPAYPAPLSDVRAPRAVAAPRAVQCLLPVLAPDRPRAAALPPAKSGGGAARLPALWAGDGAVDPRTVLCLLPVLAHA